jgi:hypothetical protein
MRGNRRRAAFAGLGALLLALASAAGARGGIFDAFRDPETGQIDLSVWLLDRKGFLPVPIFITEPAVGYGGGIAVAFFRESIAEAVAQGSKSGHLAPPDVFGGAVAGTENGTRFAGAGGMFSFRDDRWRYRGGVGWTDARLDFYGVGGSLPGGARKIAYELEGLFSTQQALLRLGDSRHFLGLRWVWLDFASLLAEEEGEPDDAELEFESRGSALGPSWEFDSRDNIFTPSRGLVAALDSLFYREEVGSDRDFETYRGYVFAYLPLGKPLVLGLRADARAARGDVPFYQLPFIDLRGVPLGRYQDENAGVLEAELRWTFADRWGLVLFAGDGRAWGAREAFDEAEDQVAGGVGIRYEIARRLGLWAGLDVARGPEEEAFYLQVGSGWR